MKRGGGSTLMNPLMILVKIIRGFIRAQPAKRNELLRKSENMLSMVSELAFGTDISVESDALDAEFLAEIGN